MEKSRLDINLVLPDVADARDRCVRRLTELLEQKKGIAAAHLVEKNDPQQLCVHFDPAKISVAEVRELATRAGATISRRYGHLLLSASATRPRRARSLESEAKKVPGVLEVAASASGVVRVEFDREVTDEAKVRDALARLGWEASGQEPKSAASEHKHTHEKSNEADHDHEHGSFFGEKAELISAGLCGAILLIGWLLEFSSVSPQVPWVLYLVAYFFGGVFTFREALQNLRAGRFEIDLLMLVAAVGAAALGKWFEGALLLFLFSLGHALEHYAMGRAKRAIEALAELAPQTAIVRRGDGQQEIPVEELQLGDVVIVKPNERMPADGFVIKGSASVNQAPITGESVPVDKSAVQDPKAAAEGFDKLDAKYRIFAGTINGSAALEIQVMKVAADSTLARVVKMVSEAETQKSPTQQFTDKFERYFVPASLSLAVLLLFSWVVIDEPFRDSFYRAMAVLVAASPCALAIATPSAVLSGVARAARGGVLVKGGGPLESLGKLDAIAFDKTGTLTEGKPKLTDVVAVGGTSEEELLKIAVAVEELSDHPLAAAVVSGGKERLKNASFPKAQDVEAITGRGVKAKVDGRTVHIGKDKLFDEIEGAKPQQELRDAVEKLKSGGRTTMVVRQDDKFLGVLGLMDTPREAAKQTITRLEQLGIRRTIMLSGDNQQVADAIAKQVGISEAVGDLMPEDKVEAVKKLSKQGVAMVGDGVNDAPAMAVATVGIAMGAAGSDVALETADVALMADDLAHLPFAVGLSRQTSRVIRQNLWFSLGMVAFLIPATILGLQIGAAVVFHEGSTLLVVFNGLRLLAYRE